MRNARLLLPIVLVAIAAVGGAGAAHAQVTPSNLGFQPVIVLGNDPSKPVGVGGEPSIQDDGQGHVYVTSPVGIDTAVVNQTGVLTINEATGGGALWRSLDGGTTFIHPRAPQFFGTPQGGGDTDVTADNSGTVYTADLEAAATDIQHSTDHGATFSSPAQNGPDNDREWLTPVGKRVFLTYHDFVTNYDFIYVSTDGGTTFIPTGTAGKVINPVDNPTAASDCANGNLISKPVTDSSGGLYVLLNCSTFPNNASPTGAPLDRLYIAISRDGGSSFHTTLVSDVSNGGTNNGTWGHVFNQLAIDAVGNLYVGASGNLHGTDPVQTFLIRSLDNGATWQAPLNLNADTPNYASVFPAIAAGQSGQVAVGYYRVVNCRTSVNAACKTSDYRNDGVTFQFFIWQTLNATQVNPDFAVTQVTSTVPHYNGICTDGLFCGTPLSAGGNRNLADFESMTVDPTGHIELVIPADPDNVDPKSTTTAPTVNWYFKETSGPLMPPGATNGNGTGNQTYVAASLALPEVPWTALLLVPGALIGAGVVARRRRRGEVLAA